MLENIIDSKHESLVLGFFLAAPQRSFSPIEVSRRVGVSSEKASSVLRKLAHQGQLSVFSKKGKRYYMLNAKFRFVPEVRSYMQRQGTKYEDELYTAIRKLGEIKAAFLSGIFTGNPNLPVDILLVGKVNLTKLTGFMKSVEKLMGQEVNYSVMTVDEFQTRRYTFDRFIKDIFDHRHLVVVDELDKKKSKSFPSIPLPN